MTRVDDDLEQLAFYLAQMSVVTSGGVARVQHAQFADIGAEAVPAALVRALARRDQAGARAIWRRLAFALTSARTQMLGERADDVVSAIASLARTACVNR